MAELLRVGGLSPEEVDAVVFSHVHYEHIGTPGDFEKAVFVVGPVTERLLTYGMKCHSSAHFQRDLLSEERTVNHLTRKLRRQVSVMKTTTTIRARG